MAGILHSLRRWGELRSGDGNEMSWQHSGDNIFLQKQRIYFKNLKVAMRECLNDLLFCVFISGCQ
jgi:hypothetical protein